ncbi:MAG: hypothetical protein M0P73_07540 [Syntrophobacterales bacterium]|jgi:hypothetical protein|nr:hypothetical protein [Syntrophobacterales bacterium]
MEKAFSNAELSKIIDKTSRFVIDWSARGLIEADITPATGPGSRRRYSYQALLRAALGIYLKDHFGMSRNVIKRIIEDLWNGDFFVLWSADFVEPAHNERSSGCLVILFYDNGHYKLVKYRDHISQVMPELASQLKDIRKTGLIIINIVLVDLGVLKGNIDKRIKALG